MNAAAAYWFFFRGKGGAPSIKMFIVAVICLMLALGSLIIVTNLLNYLFGWNL